MRNFGISLGVVGAALIVGSPAAAQYYPQQQYGYGQQPYGYNGGYGYNGFNNGYVQVHALQARIDALQNQIRYMGPHNGGRGKSAKGLREESRNLERRLHNASRNGLNPYEMNDISQRIARLEQRLQYSGGNRYGRAGYNSYDNGQGYYGDRGEHHGDRDRDDHDRGYDRDD